MAHYEMLAVGKSQSEGVGRHENQAERATAPTTETSLLDYGRRLHRIELHRLKMKHRAGLGGREVVRARSQVVDHLVTRIYTALWSLPVGEEPFPSSGVAIVALGGYGRQELAPFSDVDIMFLKPGQVKAADEVRIQKMLCLLWDMGFQVGHSVRTIKEALEVSSTDLISQVSMLDARLIIGDGLLFNEFLLRICQSVSRKRRAFIQKMVMSLQERHKNQGGTAFVREPNLKEAKGGLRDFHSVLWLGKGLYPGATLEEVMAKAQVSVSSWASAVSAYEFLLRIRNELHFLTINRTDTLSNALLSPVIHNLYAPGIRHKKDGESFLKHYYHQARRISEVLDSLVQQSGVQDRRGTSWLENWRAKHPVQKARGRLSDPSQTRPSLNPEKWMQVFRYGQSDLSMIHQGLRQSIRQNLRNFKRTDYSAPGLTAHFRAILRNKGSVAPAIRLMHELGLLGRVLPEFGRLAGLVHPDLYHKHTVDEHSLRTLDILDGIASGQEGRHSPYQRIFNEIHNASSLYYASLVQDAELGLGGKHSSKVETLIQSSAQRLGFDPDEIERIQALVRHRSLMARFSQRRNLDDPHTIESFVKPIERTDLLNMLLLMTYADARAVGPGTWTEWKDYQLLDLYHKAYDRMMFSEEVPLTAHLEAESVCRQVTDLLAGEVEESVIRKHFEQLPEKYAIYTPVTHIVEHLKLTRIIQERDPAIQWIEQRDKGYTDMILATRDHPGLFAQIAGTLAAFNLNLLSAQLNTRSDEWVFDVFQVGGCTKVHSLHPEDYPRIEKKLELVIRGEQDPEDMLKPRENLQLPALRSGEQFSPRILIDNESSPSASVIEVQAEDRVGLGFRIARILAGFKLNITFAKLVTEKAHAFDVFYVQDGSGRKILDHRRMTELVETLRGDLSKGIQAAGKRELKTT
ncbi:MAG TPA: [protein-PII] uridylyltransferase [Terriglobia bacterium]|nr:[protein-PII] uridylyltransferase [Terriglobia bacterium]